MHLTSDISHVLPDPLFIEFISPGEPEPFRLELWEAEQFIEETHTEAEGDAILWVKKTREKLESEHGKKFTLEQTDFFIRKIRREWDDHRKKDTGTPGSLSGLASPPEPSPPTGKESS